jgi:TRAP-type mannitol/chloroaromatic compound transport system permease small subunit
MFGMQYVLSGAYALREGAHVRVDVLYERFSFRTRAKIDLVTSIVFFIFTGTLLVTGIMFAAQSVGDMEVSFNEWQIQYWPAKVMIAVGALLLLLQGIAQVIRDVHFLRASRGKEEG